MYICTCVEGGGGGGKGLFTEGKFKTNSSNTVEMYLNNGWQLSFRIHNASSKVEPSLKFDVQFIGMPISILNIECKWS